jgi:hypothetical protein
MLKKSASFVLAALGASTYRKTYAFGSSLAAAALDGHLTILQTLLVLSALFSSPVFHGAEMIIQEPALLFRLRR